VAKAVVLPGMAFTPRMATQPGRDRRTLPAGRKGRAAGADGAFPGKGRQSRGWTATGDRGHQIPARVTSSHPAQARGTPAHLGIAILGGFRGTKPKPQDTDLEP